MPRDRAKRPWSLRDRLDERDIADLITAYHERTTTTTTTTTTLAAAHGLSLNSVKRLLHITGARQTSPPSTSHEDNAGRDASCPAFTAHTAAEEDIAPATPPIAWSQ